jgi:hypothetical protein
MMVGRAKGRSGIGRVGWEPAGGVGG